MEIRTYEIIYKLLEDIERAMVGMLREAGAKEVHLRVSSPPYRWPCFYGMDTGTRGELLAANLSVAEIQKIRQLQNEYGLNVSSIGSPIRAWKSGVGRASTSPAA